MGVRLRPLLLRVCASMVLGALVCGTAGLVLGLLAEGMGATGALVLGVLAGALVGALASGGPGLRFFGPQNKLMGRENSDDPRR